MDDAARERYLETAVGHFVSRSNGDEEKAATVMMGVALGIQLHEAAPEEAMRFLRAFAGEELHQIIIGPADQLAAEMREW